MLEIGTDALTIKKEIGQGRFGRIAEAVATGLHGSTQMMTPVVVAYLNDLDTKMDKRFHALANSIVSLHHDNHLAIVGSSLRMYPHFLIFDAYPNGDLKTFLKFAKQVLWKRGALLVTHSYPTRSSRWRTTRSFACAWTPPRDSSICRSASTCTATLLPATSF